jgi:ligand-binding sensor domain-containing protein
MLVRASRSRTCWLLIVLWLPTLLAAQAPAPTSSLAFERGLPLVRSFPPRAYGAANQVWEAVVARNGTLYFGNNHQVLAFDGLNWTSIAVAGGAHIRALAIDAEDTVWVGGVNELGRIRPSANGEPVFESLRGRVPASVGDLKDIWRVHATSEGIWFTSNQAVLRWRDEHFEVWMMQERHATLSYWLDDHLLVAREKGWFRPAAGGEWQELGDPAAKLGDYLPNFMLPHPSGRGWLTMLQGPRGQLTSLAQWDGAKLTFSPHPLDPYLKGKRLYRGLRLRDGRYVFGLLQGGALILSPTLEFETLLDEANGFPSQAAISIAEDAHGALWFGTEFGIARVFAHPAYTWFTGPSGISRGSAHPTLRWQGQLVVGTSTGVVRLRPGAEPPAMPRFEPWPGLDDKVNTLAAVDEGLMVGALGGAWFMTPDGAQRIERSGSNLFAIVSSRLRPGNVYAATINGLLHLRRQPDGKWSAPRFVSGARGSSLHEDDDGSLWIGTDNQGVIRVRLPANGEAGEPQIARFHTEAGLPADPRKIKIAHIGGAPLFLTNGGLYRFDSASQRFSPEPRYGARFANGSTTVETIAEDVHGGLWIIARRAGSVDPNEVKQLGYVRDGQWQPFPLPGLERIDGFGVLRVESVEGRELLWLNGQSAILRVDLTLRRALGDAPIGRTVLHPPVSSDRRPLQIARRDSNGRPQFASAENSLRFRFGTPGLAGEPDVRHETRLRGFGDGGVELGAAGERTFTNLPAGDYVFEVRGRSADGRWSEPATFAFQVLAPWWQTAWAFSGYALLLGLGTYGIVRRRTHALENERRRLEAVVNDRTSELAQKNLELERLNRMEQDEKLSARLAEEKARLELLRYQLNPHFLFNSLNSIRALVYANPEAAGEMVTRLAEFCRWTLTRGSDETTTVADEAEMVRTYLEIEKVRWGTALETIVEIDAAALTERLPQFLLLPLIENAIKYGGRTSPDILRVRVTIRLEGESIAAEVANTGTWVEPSATPSPTSTHIGLENLRQRLARHYDRRWQFTTVSDTGWVRMQLRLPRGLPAVPARPSRDPFSRP